MKIRNLNLFKASVVLLCGTTACYRVKKQQDTVQSNIIYIMTDDHAYQAISCYNGKLNQTPNIDRIANEGVIFTRSFVTNSICAPTFLELAGVEIPNDIQGKSIVPLIEGKNTGDWRKSIYYHYYEYPGPHAVKRHYGIRTDRYKLIHFYNDINQWELYDLKQDTLEIHNLYGKEGYEEITKSLFEQMVNLQTQYNDTTAVDVRLN